jgi:NTE family protein
MPAAAITAFAVVFGLFAVVTLVLVVLVLRFALQRSAASRAEWLSSQGPDPEDDDQGDDEDEEEDEEEEPMTALVLAGGGTRGAVQVGMLQVLTEHGFRPDRIYTEVWSGLTRDTVYRQGRLHGPWLYVQQRDSVYANTGLRKVIEDGIDFERLEDAAIPVEVVATSLTDGRERWFTYGPATDAVLASAAIPAIFPPVEIDGERFIDGGVVNNVPIRRAVEAGATRIVVLLCAPAVYSPTIVRRPVEAMVNALFISIHARFARDLAQLPPGVEVIVCNGTEGANRDFDDFTSTQTLIAQGRVEAAEVVRRYGLGVPGTVTFEPTPPSSPVDVPERADDAGSDAPAGPVPVVPPAAEPPSPSTHPEPGT